MSEGERNAVTVTAYDLRNKLVAFTYTLPPSPARLSAEQDVGVPAPAPPQDAGGLARDGLSLEVEETAIEYSPSDRVLDILCDGSTVYVLTSSHTVLVLRELSTATKLDILFRKHMYSVAISLSDNSDQDYATVLDIYRMYADHLYAKGDFDGAVTQYIRTIGAHARVRSDGGWVENRGHSRTHFPPLTREPRRPCGALVRGAALPGRPAHLQPDHVPRGPALRGA